jgi:Protein of unknown function (DUF3107)
MTRPVGIWPAARRLVSGTEPFRSRRSGSHPRFLPLTTFPVSLVRAEMRRAVEVKIGIQSAPRELVLETNEPADKVEEALKAAVREGGTFTLADDKGGRVLVPADKIAYVEFGGAEQRRVGFSNL